MKNAILLACLLLLSAVGATAQGVRYDNMALRTTGQPVPGVTVAVCNAPATTSTTPCSALANVYSDEALKQPLANPFTGDNAGNYGFWAAPGHYVVQIYGAGLPASSTDVFLGTGLAHASQGVQFVANDGSDSNAGLSWSLPKLTIASACAALPNGNSSCSAGNGIIYVAPSFTGTVPTISSQGIQLMRQTPPLSTPSAPTLTVEGTAGATTISYEVVAVQGTGTTPASSSTQTTTANANLGSTNYVAVATAAVTGSTTCKVYRTATNGSSPTSTGYIGSVGCGSTLDDTGLAGDSTTAPTVNTTGIVQTALKANPADAIQYVSPNGNDSADGLSWGSAKKTLYAAVSAIESTTMNSGYSGGTIYVADGVSCGGPVTGQGLWIYANATDPGSGWIKAVSALTVVGVGNTHWGASGMGGQVDLNCGSATQPGLELTGINLPLKFQNLSFTGIQGLDVVQGSSTVTFENDTFSVDSSNATNGPAVLIGPNSFWLYFRHCVFQVNTNSSVVRNGSDAAEAFVVNPNGGSSSGLIYIDESEADSGDIKYYNGTTAESLYVNGLTTEGQPDGKGAVWIIDALPTGIFNLQNIGVNDATTNPTPAVEVDSGSAQGVLVSGASGYGVNVSGPATILSQYPSNLQNVTTDPYVSGQQGFVGTRIYGQTDAGRRLFSPTAIAWANLVGGAPSQWQTLPTLTPGGSTVAGPSGANTAYDADNSTGSSTGQVTFIDQGGTATSPGDYYVAGFWFKLKSGGYYGGNAGEFGFTCDSGSTITKIAGVGQYFNPPLGTSGMGTWNYDWSVYKITGTVTSCEVKLFGYVNSDSDVEFYMPTVIHIPAGTVTDNEAAEIGAHLANAAKGLTLPAEVSPEGLPFAFGGSGDNYYGVLDHTALTANRTYDFPDASGTIALAGAGGTSAGTITLASGAGSHTFATPYTTAPVCTAVDTTSAAAVKATSTTTTVTLAGTGTDVIAWTCTPAAN